jgi:hypothetical protein
MKKTQKYSQACAILTYPHSTQEQLYSELNRLGWYWIADQKKWERDEREANPTTNLIKIRVWAASDKVNNVAQHFVEAATDMGLRLVDQSQSYPCRPPNQNEARIYLTFEETA